MTSAPSITDAMSGPSFYRYRSARSLLGDRRELELQTVYLAGPDELNDPMEGFQDVFWAGDYVLWRNLIKHYILCILMSVEVVAILGQDFMQASLIPLLSLSASTLPTPAQREHHDHICAEFFGEEGLSDCIRLLSTVRTRVHRDELSFYLTSFHALALHHVMNRLKAVGLLNRAREAPLPENAAKTTIHNLRNILIAIERSGGSERDVTGVLLSSGNRALNQMALLNLAEGDNTINRGWRFVSFEFPEFYCQHISTILYPGWYAACFVANATHAAMWAHYGDRHEGVCLKFRTEKSAEGMPVLRLHGITGRSSRPDGTITENRGEVKFQLHKVNYAKSFPEIDFFRSLGRHPIPVLNRDWYSDEGEVSDALRSVFADEDSWRKRYWDNYLLVAATKFDDWKYEEEHRIVLHTLMDREIEKRQRLYTYNFSDLEGIVFGSNTSTDHKLEIIKTIRRKCIEAGRTEFEFLQASYSSGTANFDVFPLPHLRLT